MIAARNTLASGDFQDRDKVFKALTPSLQELRKRQARKRMSIKFARKFADLFNEGKVPDWVISLCDFETVELLTGD